MANEKHLLLTLQGGWTNAALANEVWQYGVRLVLNPTVVDDIGTLPNSWDVVAQNVARTETDWRIDGNWKVTQALSTFSPDDYLNDQVAPAAVALFGARSAFSSHCRLDQINLYPIGTNGRAIPAPPYAQGSPMALRWTSSNPVGGNGANLLPIQNSIVVSHRTNQLGRRGRGRSYWPGSTTSAVGADGLQSTADAGFNAGFEAAWLEGIAYTGPGGAGWHVRPAVIGKPWTSYATIVQVGCGVVIDTQRRRRNRLDENTQYSAVTY